MITSLIHSRFDTLPAHPPTPPRETIRPSDAATPALDGSTDFYTVSKHPYSNHSKLPVTSDLLPSPSRDINLDSNTSKRVGFLAGPVYFDIPASGRQTSSSPKLVKDTRPGKNGKSPKSILKPASALPPPTPEDLNTKLSYFSPEVPGSLAKMLQSVIHQLAGSSRAARLDAYLALNGALKAYGGIPNKRFLAQRMGLFMQFLSRDIVWKDEDGQWDLNIIVQALKLTMTILFEPGLAPTLDDDFRTFLVDRSIGVLESADMPKALVKTHMFVLAQQRFPPQIMTNSRVDRLVTALATIEGRCTGNNAVMTRLILYTRLSEQAPGLMLTRMQDWLHHVLHGMLSSIRDVRIRGIETCTQAGLIFGVHSTAAKSLHEMFDTETDKGETNCEYFTARLFEMMTDKEMGAYVPQIWSSIILFFRSKSKTLERWPKFKHWLLVLQKCLNSSDLTVKYQATLAWDRLVFVVMPSAATPSAMMSMLRVPLAGSLERRSTDKHSQQFRHFALDSYYKLLHYALRPGLSAGEYDSAWDMYVQPLVTELARSKGKGRETACRVLQGLVNGTNGVWDVNAALNATPIKPQELSRIDAKWVRTRLARVLKLLEPILQSEFEESWNISTTVDATWIALMKALCDAGSQEVKISSELKYAIALLINFLQRLLARCAATASSERQGLWLEKYTLIVDSTVEILGPGAFTEDFLVASGAEYVEVARTPSHRHPKQSGNSQPAIMVLFRQLYRFPLGSDLSDRRQSAASALLERIVSSKSTCVAKLSVLNRCLSHEVETRGEVELRTHLWIICAETAREVLRSTAFDQDMRASYDLGHGLRVATEILTNGLDVCEGGQMFTLLQNLYEGIVNSASRGAADGGVVLGAMEPAAKALVQSGASASLKAKAFLAARVLSADVWPLHPRTIDIGRKALWGDSLAAHKTVLSDPFQHVYAMIIDTVDALYEHLDDGVDVPMCRELLTATTAFLRAAPLSLLVTALRKIQRSFVVWIEDKQRKTAKTAQVSELVGRHYSCAKDSFLLTTLQVLETWSIILRLLNTCPKKDSALLKALEPLFVAGLSSPHKTIVKDTIRFWNQSFGTEDSLDYPSTLRDVLRTRAMDTDIELPAFPESTGDFVPADFPDFFPSQQEVGQDAISTASGPMLQLGGSNSNLQALAQQHATQSPADHSPIAGVVEPSSRSSRNSTPKALLPYDDSRIQFAAIESSPFAPPDESQMLTDHQKGVKASQLAIARQFPDLSSSPLAQSTALQRSLLKKPDFRTRQDLGKEDQAPGTPTALPEATSLMSDDLPSSPTPSAGREAGCGVVDDDEFDNDDHMSIEPPSSPPRGTLKDDNHSIDVAELNNEEPDVADEDEVATGDLPVIPGNKDELEDDRDRQKPTRAFEIELPSDTQLPTMQLQLEEETAAALSLAEIHAAAPVDRDNAPEHFSARLTKPETAERSSEHNRVDATDFAPIVAGDEPERTTPTDITRVEDSFVAYSPANNEEESQSTSGSQSIQRASRKRKRQSSTMYTNKKRKQQSPFKRFFSSLLGQSQEEDDEDIGEEIVVASSQRSSSPAAEGVEDVHDGKEQNPGHDVALARPARRPLRRPTPASQSRYPQVAASTLKRKASVLSNESNSETQVSIYVASSAGTPAKARKKAGRPPTRRTDTSQERQASQASSQTRRRKLRAVVIDNTALEIHDHESIVQGSTAKQPPMRTDRMTTPEALAARNQANRTVSDRPMLTPRSILGRLRGVLTDLKGIILGPQEVREFDDMLFELRTETHEAGRRERAMR